MKRVDDEEKRVKQEESDEEDTLDGQDAAARRDKRENATRNRVPSVVHIARKSITCTAGI